MDNQQQDLTISPNQLYKRYVRWVKTNKAYKGKEALPFNQWMEWAKQKGVIVYGADAGLTASDKQVVDILTRDAAVVDNMSEFAKNPRRQIMDSAAASAIKTGLSKTLKYSIYGTILGAGVGIAVAAISGKGMILFGAIGAAAGAGTGAYIGRKN